MKNKFSVILGALLGIVFSLGIISSEAELVPEAEAVGNTWSTYNFFEWKDIFGPSKKGKDMYNLVYNKLAVQPEEDAIAEIGKQFGLGTAEVKQVIAGSITPIFNAQSRGLSKLTKERAYQQMQQIQEDFVDVMDIAMLQQQIDLEVTPSEIFSNGDLSDSGFDLVSDLELIEKILFIETSDVTVGGAFESGLDSPFSPVDGNNLVESSISPQKVEPALGNIFALLSSEGEGELEDLEEAEVVLAPGSDEELLGGAEEFGDVLVLDADICLAGEDDYAQLIEDLEDADEDGVFRPGASGSGDDSDGDGDAAGGALGDEAGALSNNTGDLDGGGAKAPQNSVVDENGQLKPAPPGKWGSEWCPGLNKGEAKNESAANMFAGAGFRSLAGEGRASSLSDFFANSGGAATGIDAPGFSAHIGVCFDTELIWKTVSSYRPGDSCVNCEIEGINEILKETLSKSLVPNKATGNLLESGKCKASFGVSAVDMQFIAIPAPVQTPPNDDLIVGKNIFEEWNKFVENYNPLLYPKTDRVTETLSDAAPAGTSQDTLLSEIQGQQAKDRTAALNKMKSAEISNVATNTITYTEDVLREMKQMRSFFEGFNVIYDDVIGICKAITSKKNIE